VSQRTAVIVARGASQNHQHSWGNLFAEGMRRHGWNAQLSAASGECDLLVVWSARQQSVINAQLARGGRVCVLERGYVGDRFAWTSVSFGGGLNGRGVFHGPLDDGSRWEQNFVNLMRSWQGPSQGYVLIMGQVRTDFAVRGVDTLAWYAKAAEELRAKRHEVFFRQHPDEVRRRMMPQRVPGAPNLGGTLEAAMAGARRVVTFNSNSAVDSVLAGVPTVAMDQGSMAWDVTGHRVADEITPDRQKWAKALAWKQWGMEEFKSGDCWHHVQAGAG